MYCLLNAIELLFKLVYTFIITSKLFTPASKAKFFRRVVCWFVSSDDPFADSVIAGLDVMTTLHDLSISDIMCGMYLNNLVWHHRHKSDYPFDDVHHLRVDEYLAYHSLHKNEYKMHTSSPPATIANEDNSEEGWKEESLQPTFEMSEQTREELLYFVKYANAIYGLALYVDLLSNRKRR